MPLDIEVVYAGGLVEHYNIPLVSMYGAKKDPKYDVLTPWAGHTQTTSSKSHPTERR